MSENSDAERSAQTPDEGRLGDQSQENRADSKEENAASVAPPVDQRRTKPKKGKHWKYVKRVMSVLTIAFVGIYTVLTFCVLVTTQRSSEQQHADTVSALTKANAANDIAQTHMKLDERAWLGVSVSSSQPVVGEAMIVKIAAINTGKTYALDVNNCAGTTTTSGAAYSSAIACGASASKLRELGSIRIDPPNSVWTQESFAPTDTTGLTKLQVKSLNDGRTVVWFFGTVTYRDIFGCHHWTEFCYVRQVSSKGESAVA